MYMTINNTQDIVAKVVQDVSKAVVSTMGPNGKLALIGMGTSKKVTKDGVTVAKSIKFSDPFMEIVNKVITEPAIKTDMECGDGTTTTILLTARLYDVFHEFPGYREHAFIEKIGKRIIDRLMALSIQVKIDSPELYQLALTSSNSDAELSRVITEIYAQSGDKFPEIELKEGVQATDKVVRSNGLPIKMLFSNPSFSLTGSGGDTEYKQYVPIILDDNLRSMSGPEFMEVIGKLHKNVRLLGDNIAILLIARSIDNSINSMLLTVNSQIQGPQFVGIQTNVGGSVGTLLMQDIAIMMGVPLFKTLEDTLSKDVTVCGEPLVVGSSRSVFTQVTQASKDRIASRITEIETELGGYEAGERFGLRAKFNETRVRNLKGELVTVFVGGETLSDVKERVDRFEDVTKAIRSALVNGILPGVGTALLKAGHEVFDEIDEEELNDFPVLREIVTALGRVVYAPFQTLMEGIVPAEEMGSVVIVMKKLGYVSCLNLATGQYGTPESMGIYDTAYASITALKGGLQTAKILASIDSILLGDKLSAVKIQD